jgi:hypothetical protein
METTSGMIESIVERVEAYGKTSIELDKLKGLETSTTVASSLIARLGVISVISLFVFVLSIGIAMWLGDLLGKSYYGFFIMAAFYLVTGVVLHFFLYKWIKKPFGDFLITQVLQ